MMSQYKELLDLYVDRYNPLDLDGVMDLYAEDAVQLMPEGIFKGRKAISERLARDLRGPLDFSGLRVLGKQLVDQ
jgi:ketosteroid isomerase-like protein